MKYLQQFDGLLNKITLNLHTTKNIFFASFGNIAKKYDSNLHNLFVTGKEEENMRSQFGHIHIRLDTSSHPSNNAIRGL